MGVLRLFGLTLVLGASAWLMRLSYALYTHGRYGLTALVDLGMPAALRLGPPGGGRRGLRRRLARHQEPARLT